MINREEVPMELRNLIKVTVFAFAMMGISSWLPLQAVDVINLNSASGTWTNAKSGTGTPSNLSGSGTSTIHWGNGSPNSGYNFTGAAPPISGNLPIGTLFDLGTFTHINFPITGNALTNVNLNVSAGLNINGTPITFMGIFPFIHNETPNNFSPSSDPRNNDIVTFDNSNISSNSDFVIGGTTYTIGLVGFSQFADGHNLLPFFSTQENATNTAFLFAQIDTREHFGAPEPATYLLLGGLMALCLLVAHRRKQCKQKA